MSWYPMDRFAPGDGDMTDDERELEPGEQGSVRQFSCIHGVEPDGWCAQCDPEESARYLDSLGDGPAVGRELHG